MAARYNRGLLLGAVLLGFLKASSTFEVIDDSGKTCILANFSVQFIVEYSTSTKSETQTISLPPDAHVLKNESSCGKGKEVSQILAVGFGHGHSILLTFEKTSSSYAVSTLKFSYNLSDTSVFPNATGGEKEASNATDIKAALNTRYRCLNKNTISMANVTVLFSNVTLEAYLTRNTFSGNETICFEDRATTVPPATTSHIPTTTSLAPSPSTKDPDVGHYNVSGSHGICLLASMGLQVNITYSTKNETINSQVFNFPQNPSYSGSCDNNTVTLNLISGSTSLRFQFVQNASTDKYFLQGLSMNTSLPSEAKGNKISAGNNSLSALKATIGKSYRCVAEENVWISENASVNIFNVQVQAFKIPGDKFGSVEECQLDENNMLIPIIVGAALAGLVLIVLIAYLIGRKRSHAGYQTI
uniref:Lysosome-associated membrane glycoprotein 1 n=1 Tax=Pogona vitticeps TaxID=103695 RepID=A0ABM5FZ87_9SAUR